VLASPANAPILRNEPYVRELVVFDRKRLAAYPAMVRRLRRAHYDVVVDCMVTAPSLTTLLLMWASGAPHRVGVAGRGNDAAYTLLVPTLPWARHITEHLASLVTAFGVEAAREHARPSLTVSEDERRRAESEWNAPSGSRFLVNVSAGTANRAWPDDRYVRAISHARTLRPELCVLLTSAPGDGARARAIAERVGGRHAVTKGIRDAIALVATADFLLTPDTSIAHASSALGTPAVSMHLAWTAERWGALGSSSHNVPSEDGTLSTLEVEPVLRALDSMLGAPSPEADTAG
jgi:ADP-heptose:LPS heptosyltransferase